MPPPNYDYANIDDEAMFGGRDGNFNTQFQLGQNRLKSYDRADFALMMTFFFIGLFISWYLRGKKDEKLQLDYLLKKFQG